jgi:hypothetical protein
VELTLKVLEFQFNIGHFEKENLFLLVILAPHYEDMQENVNLHDFLTKH